LTCRRHDAGWRFSVSKAFAITKSKRPKNDGSMKFMSSASQLARQTSTAVVVVRSTFRREETEGPDATV